MQVPNPFEGGVWHEVTQAERSKLAAEEVVDVDKDHRLFSKLGQCFHMNGLVDQQQAWSADLVPHQGIFADCRVPCVIAIVRWRFLLMPL